MVCIQDPICNLLLCSICFDNTKSVVCIVDYADGNWLYSWRGKMNKSFNDWEMEFFIFFFTKTTW